MVMTEWLVLALIVPAVVVPVVLLAGFAGCDQVFGLQRPDTPTIVSAEGKNSSAITLTWTFPSTALEFEFERMKLPERTRQTFKAPASPFDDDNEGLGLEAATSYLYRVRAILNDGEYSPWSDDEPTVPGTTLSFATAFAWTPDEDLRSADDTLEGVCLVQRIEPARLSGSGTQIRLTLRAGLAGPAVIARVYISQADPAPQSDPFDSDVDPTVVTVNVFTIAANRSLTLPPVHYNFDVGRPLLVAVDFIAGAPASVAVVDNIASTEVSAYICGVDQGGIRDRTGAIAPISLYLVEKIEVG
jgi:hypothetical protein